MFLILLMLVDDKLVELAVMSAWRICWPLCLRPQSWSLPSQPGLSLHSGSASVSLALRLAHVLLGIGHALVLGVQLGLKLTDAGVHLSHVLLAALEGLGLGLVDAGLHVLDLGIQKLALPLKTLSSILLTAELIGKPGGIDHGTLGLLLAESGLGSHLIEVAGESGLTTIKS